MTQKFFKLHEEVFLIPGNNPAIYNTFSGQIFCIQEEEATILQKLENGSSINTIENSEKANELIDKLAKNKLGSTYNNNVYVEKINMYPKWIDYLSFKPAPIVTRVTLEVGGCQKKCKNCDETIYHKYTECYVNSKLGNKPSQLNIDDYKNIIQVLKQLDCNEILLVGNDNNHNSKLKNEIIKTATAQAINRVKYIHCSECLNVEDALELSHMGAILILQINYNYIDYHLLAKLQKLNLKFSILLVIDYDIQNEQEYYIKNLEKYTHDIKIEYVFKNSIEVEKVKEIYHSIIPKIGIAEFSYNRRFNRCLNGTFTILSDGSITPCLGLREIVVGNHKNICDIFNEEGIYKFWELNKDKDEKCNNCGLRYACFDCKSLEKKLGGTLNLTVSCRR